MLIKRDFLANFSSISSLEAILLWGPRQVGKTTLLEQLSIPFKVYLDDLLQRQKADSDPAFFLDSLGGVPCLIDEVQYAPNLFPEIKLRIDQDRRKKRTQVKAQNPKTMFFLTGSNRLLLDKKVKESLAGRCSFYNLHGLSIREILTFDPNIPLKTMLYRGGLPDLYAKKELKIDRYLNDYILSFVEKDIALVAGIHKLGEFHTVLGLLAARNGHFLNFEEVSKTAGVDIKTIMAWADLLKRNSIIELVGTYATNLSKRITKRKKLFFYDSGICARLQGHSQEETLWNSPQIGGLFEAVVFSEIIKTRDNFLKNWQLFTWRTRDDREIDFILETPQKLFFIEAKLGIHSVRPFELDLEAKKVFKEKLDCSQKIVVTAGGERETQLDKETVAIPIQEFGNFLLKNL